MSSLLVQSVFYGGCLAVILSIAIGLITLYESYCQEQISLTKSGDLNPYKSFNQLINYWFFRILNLDTVHDYLITKFGEEGGYYASCYLRDLVTGFAVYWITAGLWHIYIYNLNGDSLFVKKGRPFPQASVIIDQMLLAQSSLFAYAGLPVFSEYLIEKKWTRTYFYLEEIGGWQCYVLYFFVYLALVDIGVYWVHRTLHENKFLYKYIHGLHHKYNKATTLTPWASIAFNPVDGLLQVMMLF
jgi:hypothetical protein